VTSFDPSATLVLVEAVLYVPGGSANVRLTVDTGATHSLLGRTLLESLGVNLSTPSTHLRFFSATGTELVPMVDVELQTLGEERRRVTVAAHDLPPEAPFDGLLGLNFFRDRELCIDFRAGRIDLR
jgi:predicted aspartyl protease